MQGLSHLLQVATPGLGSWNIWLIWRQVISSKNGVDQDFLFKWSTATSFCLKMTNIPKWINVLFLFLLVKTMIDHGMEIVFTIPNCAHKPFASARCNGEIYSTMTDKNRSQWWFQWRELSQTGSIYIYICVFMLSIVFLWTCDKQVRVLHFQSHRIPWEIRSPSADPIHPATEVAGPWLWQIWTFTPKPFWAKAARTLVLWLSLQRPSRNHRDCAWNCRIYNEYIYIYTDMMMMMIIVMIIIILIVIIMMTTITIILMMIITILATIYN